MRQVGDDLIRDNAVDQALVELAEAVCVGGFSTGWSMRSAGGGTGPPPNLKAMIRLAFSNFTIALLGGAGPSAMPVPP